MTKDPRKAGFERDPPREAAPHDRVIVYVTDPGYFLPTLVSAEQAHLQTSDLADVVIGVVNASDDQFRIFAEVAGALGLGSFHMGEVRRPEGAFWRENYVSDATLARFLLPRFLDAAHRHVVYIDSDTQIVGDVRPLVALDVPFGLLAAAPDTAWLANQKEIFPDAYIKEIGITDPSTYFNAGVLALARETFDEIMPEAMAFFLSNSELCRHKDQSALNAIMNKRRFVLSPRYNYLSNYDYTNFALEFDPVIMHFNGGKKPWKTDGPPWNGRFLPSYESMLRRFPALQPFASPVERYVPPASAPRASLLRRLYYSPAARPLRKAVHRYKCRVGITKTLRHIDLH